MKINVFGSWAGFFPETSCKGMAREDMDEKIHARLDVLSDDIHARWAASKEGEK